MGLMTRQAFRLVIRKCILKKNLFTDLSGFFEVFPIIIFEKFYPIAKWAIALCPNEDVQNDYRSKPPQGRN